MGKIGAYQPEDRHKNYSLPSSKPFRSHTMYQERVWTLQEKIHRKLKRVGKFLESLYPKITDKFKNNITGVIERNLGILIDDLNQMEHGFHKNPFSFHTNKLKTNQQCINEMKNVCNTLQTVNSFENEFKRLGKIKHALSELEHLIQPSNFEKSLEKAQLKIQTKKAKKVAPPPSKAKKTTTKVKKTIKVKTTPQKAKPAVKQQKTKISTAKTKKHVKKAAPKKAKPAAKLQKTKISAVKVKKPVKKAAIKKAKPIAPRKTAAPKKPKAKSKLPVALKKK